MSCMRFTRTIGRILGVVVLLPTLILVTVSPAAAGHYNVTATFAGTAYDSYPGTVLQNLVWGYCYIQGNLYPTSPYDLSNLAAESWTNVTSATATLVLHNATSTVFTTYGPPSAYQWSGDRNNPANTRPSMTVSWTWVPDYQGEQPPAGNATWLRTIKFEDSASVSIYTVPYGGSHGTATATFDKSQPYLTGDPTGVRPAFIYDSFLGYLRDTTALGYTVSVTGPPSASNSVTHTYTNTDSSSGSTTAGSSGSVTYALSWDFLNKSEVTGSGLGSGSGASSDTVLTFSVALTLPH